MLSDYRHTRGLKLSVTITSQKSRPLDYRTHSLKLATTTSSIRAVLDISTIRVRSSRHSSARIHSRVHHSDARGINPHRFSSLPSPWTTISYISSSLCYTRSSSNAFSASLRASLISSFLGSSCSASWNASAAPS